MASDLEQAIRDVLLASTDKLCARQVAELVTQRSDGAFGGCGPETDAVEDALLAMDDVNSEDDEEAESEWMVYWIDGAAAKGDL